MIGKLLKIYIVLKALKQLDLVITNKLVVWANFTKLKITKVFKIKEVS